MAVGRAASRRVLPPAGGGGGRSHACAPLGRRLAAGRIRFHPHGHGLSRGRLHAGRGRVVSHGPRRRPLGRLAGRPRARTVGRSGQPALPRPRSAVGRGPVLPAPLFPRRDREGGGVPPRAARGEAIIGGTAVQVMIDATQRRLNVGIVMATLLTLAAVIADLAIGGRPDPKALRAAATTLDGAWRFHTGDEPGWANANTDDSDWETID